MNDLQQQLHNINIHNKNNICNEGEENEQHINPESNFHAVYGHNHVSPSHQGENDYAANTNKEFIKRLVNDYIHFRIYGKDKNKNKNDKQKENKEREWKKGQQRLKEDGEHLSKTDNGKTERFRKTSKTLRKISLEMEQTHSLFFENVCTNLKLEPVNAEKTFQTVSEEVLEYKTLNWGRVVSLFTFGGKLAEWFWEKQEVEKLEEVEDWLTESLSSKEEWIERNGGWVSLVFIYIYLHFRAAVHK